jgi:glycerophosphoryl diester phosphodiesterase
MTRLKIIFAISLLLASCLYRPVNMNTGQHTNILRSNQLAGTDSVVFIAHRGIAGYYPENSLHSIEASVQYGFHGVEVDISRSADSLIVFHDEDGKRLLGIDKKIKSLSTSELKKLPLVYCGKKSQCYILTVPELLASKNENLFLYFDMKVNSNRDAAEIAKLVRASGLTNSVIVASESPRFIFYLERNYPDIVTCLEGFDAGKEWTYQLMPGKLRPDYYSGYIQNTTAGHISWLKKHRLMSRRIVYGVDSSNLETALRSGFRNIMLDYDSCMHLNGKLNGKGSTE